jgi:hypothetical protein
MGAAAICFNYRYCQFGKLLCHGVVIGDGDLWEPSLKSKTDEGGFGRLSAPTSRNSFSYSLS